MVSLDGGGSALTPGAGQVEIVGRLAADVAFANMFLLPPSVSTIVGLIVDVVLT